MMPKCCGVKKCRQKNCTLVFSCYFCGGNCRDVCQNVCLDCAMKKILRNKKSMARRGKNRFHALEGGRRDRNPFWELLPGQEYEHDKSPRVDIASAHSSSDKTSTMDILLLSNIKHQINPSNRLSMGTWMQFIHRSCQRSKLCSLGRTSRV